MRHSFLLGMVGLLLLIAEATFGQETLQPEAAVDPLRGRRIEQRDAWGKLALDLHERDEPRWHLLAAWALFHQFDVDYFALAESNPDELLDKYDRQARAWRTALADKSDADPLERLAVDELAALLDDLEANRIQNARPEGATPEALQVWAERFEKFQVERVRAMQSRGKRVVTLYQDDVIDAVRLCIVLLERQIAERVLLEHREMHAPADQAEKFAEQRRSLLAKQRTEWKRVGDLMPVSKAPQTLIDMGGRICHLHNLTVDLLAERALADSSEEGGQKLAALAKRLFAAYQDLHRASSAAHVEGKLSLEQLARIHDLRMYTTIWNDPALPPADVIADGIEVAEMWKKVHQQLAEEDPDSVDARIALAKKLEAEIVRDERKGPATGESAAPAPAEPNVAEPAAEDSK